MMDYCQLCEYGKTGTCVRKFFNNDNDCFKFRSDDARLNEIIRKVKINQQIKIMTDFKNSYKNWFNANYRNPVMKFINHYMENEAGVLK